MDISSIKAEINKLSKLARETDSKRQDLEYKLQIKELEKQLEEHAINVLKNVPETVKLHIKVDKIVNFDTSDFLDYLYNYIQDNNEYDFNIDHELMDYLHDFLVFEEMLDYSDYEIELEK